MNTYDQIAKCIKWLDEHKDSTSYIPICQTIDRLAVLSVTVGQEVSESYALQNNLEDDYDIAFAERFSTITKEGTSAAAARYVVEAELGEKKRLYTQAKNGYKKLSVYLERLDRVIESYRQLVSVGKMDLKLN
jgi:hypothetical protein